MLRSNLLWIFAQLNLSNMASIALKGYTSCTCERSAHLPSLRRNHTPPFKSGYGYIRPEGLGLNHSGIVVQSFFGYVSKEFREVFGLFLII